MHLPKVILNTFAIFLSFSWFIKQHPRVFASVKIPPRPEDPDDVLRTMTVIPSLHAMHYGDDSEEDEEDEDQIHEFSVPCHDEPNDEHVSLSFGNEGQKQMTVLLSYCSDEILL